MSVLVCHGGLQACPRSKSHNFPFPDITIRHSAHGIRGFSWLLCPMQLSYCWHSRWSTWSTCRSIVGKQPLPKCCNACSRFLLWQAVCDSAWNSLRLPDQLSYLQVSDTRYTKTNPRSGLKWDIEFLAIHGLILFDRPEFCHVVGRSGYRGCMRASNGQSAKQCKTNIK